VAELIVFVSFSAEGIEKLSAIGAKVEEALRLGKVLFELSNLGTWELFCFGAVTFELSKIVLVPLDLDLSDKELFNVIDGANKSSGEAISFSFGTDTLLSSFAMSDFGKTVFELPASAPSSVFTGGSE